MGHLHNTHTGPAAKDKGQVSGQDAALTDPLDYVVNFSVAPLLTQQIKQIRVSSFQNL